MKALPQNSVTLNLKKLSPIVLKPTSNQTLSKDQINETMSQPLDKIKVASAKVTEKGKILVNVLNKVNEIEVKETLMSTFSDNFCLEKLKRNSCLKSRLQMFRTT